MRPPTALAVLIFFSMSTSGIVAQSTPSSASAGSMIRISSPFASGSRVHREPPSHLVVDNETLRETIAFAYGLPAASVFGGPAWVGSTRYDLVVETPVQTAAIEPLLPSLQAFLADRFKLQTHREQKLMPVYNLSVGDGELKIKPSAEDRTQQRFALFVQGPPTARAVPGRNATMAEMANLMQHAIMNRPVIDKTGLTGRYNFDLEWASRQAPPGSGPDIFQAVQQLGLKLEPAQGVVDTVAVDYVEQPAAD